MPKLWVATIFFVVLCEIIIVSAEEYEEEHCEAQPEGSTCSHQLTKRKARALLQRAVSKSSKMTDAVSAKFSIGAAPGMSRTQWCTSSAPQKCRMFCSVLACPSGQCAMRQDGCCKHTCEIEKKTEWCANSPAQTCRMFCSVPTCPSGQCAMRLGSCCDHTCETAEEIKPSEIKPMPKPMPNLCKPWCSPKKKNQCTWKACIACDFCSEPAARYAPAARLTPAPTPEPSPPAESYLLTSGVSCGWGGGCTMSAQAYCYQTSDPSVPYKKGGLSKIIPRVDRDAVMETDFCLKQDNSYL